MTQTYKEIRLKTKEQGYLRWKRQLQALKKNDWYTVKQLGREAKEHLQFKRSGMVQMALH